MKTAQQKIDNASSLSELAEIMNSISAEELAAIDTSSLPTFGGPDIINTSEVWSWDEKNILVVANGWETEPRCMVCGEATFHCGC